MSGLIDPADSGQAVTLSGVTFDFTSVTRGLYLGAQGTVNIVTAAGVSLSFVDLAAGVIHPLRVRSVVISGTTATDIVGVW